MEKEEFECTASIVIADIKGSTKIVEHVPHNVLAKLFRKYFDVAEWALTKSNATISTYTGDGLTAIVGLDPILSPQNSAHAACTAAITLVQAVRKFNYFLLTQDIPASCVFVTRIGVEIGEIASLTNPTATPQLRRILVGKPFNYAQRFSELARLYHESTIIVGPQILHTLGTHQSQFKFESLPVQTLRGVSRPMTPYRLLPYKSDLGDTQSPFYV